LPSRTRLSLKRYWAKSPTVSSLQDSKALSAEETADSTSSLVLKGTFPMGRPSAGLKTSWDSDWERLTCRR
jgi:hypothetical protein